MDLSVVYSKTAKGLRARASLIGGLSSHLMRVLTHVDGTTKAELILNKYNQITEQELAVAITQLEREGYIKAIVPTKPGDNDWALTINFSPMVVEEVLSVEEAEARAIEDERLQAEREAKVVEEARLEAERKAEEKAEQAREKAKAKAEAKVNAQLEIERIAREAEVERQKIEAEKKAKAEKAARLAAESKAKAEEEARQKAELKAKAAAEARQQIEEKLEAERKAREEAEQAHAKAESETKEKVRLEIERIAREAAETQKKLEAEILAKAEAQAEARQQLEEKLNAERKASEEAARLELERKVEAEKEAKLEAEREALEIERRAKVQAELLAQKEAERQANEAEQARAKKESDAKNKADEKEHARLEIARIVREAEEARKQADAKAKEERLEAKRQAKAEAEQKKSEAEALAKAEQEEKLEAKRKAKAEQEASIDAERNAKELAEQNKAEAEIVEKAGTDANQQASLAMAQFALVVEEEARKKSEEKLAREKQAEEAKLEKALKANTEAELIRANVHAEEQAKAKAQALANIEMEHIAQEAKNEREKQEAELATQSDNAIEVRWNVDPDNDEDDDDEAFEDEEHLAEEENKIQQVIEKKSRRESEEQGREDIRREAKDNALEMAKIKGSASPANYGKLALKVFKLTLVYLPVIGLLLIVLLHFVNISPLIDPIQKLASESLGEPVKVNEVHASLWPQPHLVLQNVTIGNSNNAIEMLHVIPETSSLSETVKKLESIEIEGLQIDQANFEQAQQWINKLGKAQHVQLAQINLKKIMFKMRDLEWGPFDGKVVLTESKQLNNIDLNSADNTLSVQLTPQADSADVVFTGTNWALPMNKKLVFDEFKAKGKLSESMIYFSQIEGRVYGGSLSAKAAIDWSSQWSLAGNFDLSKATLPLILQAFAGNAAVDGKLNLTGIFSCKSDEVAKLTDKPEITAKFEVRDGKINGVDLEQAVMSTASKSLVGDATRFDSLTGLVKINDSRYEYRQLALVANQFNASGNVDIEPNQAISGKVSADLAARSRRLHTKFDLAGKLGNVQRQ